MGGEAGSSRWISLWRVDDGQVIRKRVFILFSHFFHSTLTYIPPTDPQDPSRSTDTLGDSTRRGAEGLQAGARFSREESRRATEAEGESSGGRHEGHDGGWHVWCAQSNGVGATTDEPARGSWVCTGYISTTDDIDRYGDDEQGVMTGMLDRRSLDSLLYISLLVACMLALSLTLIDQMHICFPLSTFCTVMALMSPWLRLVR